MANPNITLVGRVASEPEFKILPSGTPVARFRVITNDRRKNAFGEWEDHDTSGWNVVAWDRLAENITGNLNKGEQVIVNGIIKEISWIDGAGNRKYSFEVKAYNIGKDMLLFKQSTKSSVEDVFAVEWS
jgi:single-strand DNA-binding protein